MSPTTPSAEAPPVRLPAKTQLYIDGAWRDAAGDATFETTNPSTGELLATVADASADDMRAAIGAANTAFRAWRKVKPAERGRILREMARIVRENARALAMIDAADCGNPYTAMLGDAAIASNQLEFFAGLVTEIKGDSIPLGPDAVNFTVREPRGVIGKILPFNHPFMFCAGKIAAPLAAGNTVVVKPPEQAPLSALLFAELTHGLMPPGVFNVVPGGREAGAALASAAGVAMVSLIGSVPTGRAVARAAAETIKPTLLELGGKNALIAFPDADPKEVAQAAVAGMNFAWCGQSCGSTSRLMLHEDLHDAVLEHLREAVARFKPGIATDPATTMGAIVSRTQYERVLDFIASANSEGARLISGGGRPADPKLASGLFVEPTVFADTTPTMRIVREEIFGPVLAVRKWRDEAAMLEEVNAVEYGLTCSIWTNDLNTAHRTAQAVEAGFVWINEVAKHFLGTPFGGYKQSGAGREECFAELIAYTQEKNIHIRLK
jgi:betaine-aldehyde dehydrogenase